MHAESLEAGLDPFADPRARPPAEGEGRVRLVGRRVRPHVVRDGGGELLHVGAVVAVLGDRLAAADGEDRSAQVVELAAGVIEVVLARDLLPAGFEDPAQEVTDERSRALPIVSGPVGLADTNSTLTRRVRTGSTVPQASGAASTASITPPAPDRRAAG